MLLVPLLFLTGCTQERLHELPAESITVATLKVYENGVMTKDIDLMEEEKLRAQIVKAYHDAEYLLSKEKEQPHQLKIDPISTDGQLEEEISASYIMLHSKTKENEYYIGYKGADVFKVIASGEGFKDRPDEYFIKSALLTTIVKKNSK
ncbi:hypothetical protein EQV77_06705 [Halobacillus fulvus]|nr:hypothetical protein EQV77_06705 [Halobacillus fulvus]